MLANPKTGIDPPRGVLLYGPPGTGKTMLVKAVANSTTASFIRVNGSEFVQKYLGEGPRMVRDVFRMARENSPAIIFIDEIDAIATKRFDAQTGADREVQRILLELLNQMDGFEQTSNVKVIMATNRADTLDPALLRPGRLDRKIEFPSLRDRRERRLIFTTIASKMSLSPEVDLDSLIVRNEPLSGAVIAAIMQEAGLRAVRKNRYNIIQSDLEDAYATQVKSGQDDDRYVSWLITVLRVTDVSSQARLLPVNYCCDARVHGKSLFPCVVLSILLVRLGNPCWCIIYSTIHGQCSDFSIMLGYSANLNAWRAGLSIRTFISQSPVSIVVQCEQGWSPPSDRKDGPDHFPSHILQLPGTGPDRLQAALTVNLPTTSVLEPHLSTISPKKTD